MSRESFLHEAKVLKYIVCPEFAFMAEVDGEPAGFMIIVPDFHHAFKADRQRTTAANRALQVACAPSDAPHADAS